MKATKTLIITLLLSGAFATAQTKYPQVVISTNYGNMTLMLYDETPHHAEYFLDLVKKNYFDGTLFQRVIKEFMIQKRSKVRMKHHRKISALLFQVFLILE